MICDQCEHCADDRVDWVVGALREKGANVRVRRRKLKHRTKIYLCIKAAGGHYKWKRIIMPAIVRFFPDAYMTSGSFSGLNSFSRTEPEMDITIALED